MNGAAWSEWDAAWPVNALGDRLGQLVEWLYDNHGTEAVLLQLEALHRRDAQRAGETLDRPGPHLELARLLRDVRVAGERYVERVRRAGR